MVKWDFKMML